MSAPRASVPRFDGAAHWATLSPDAQAEIGALALEYVAAGYAVQVEAAGAHRTAIGRAAEAAWDHLASRLEERVVELLPAGDVWRDGATARIPSLLGPLCRRCGCSEPDACLSGCGWAEPDLCTACQEPGRMSAPVSGEPA